MTEQYSQTVEVPIDGRTKAMQWIGVASFFIAFGFFMAAVFYSWYFALAAAAFAVVCIADLHFYNATAKEFTYDASKKRLVVSKKDIVNRQRRVLSVLFEDVTEFAPLEGMTDNGDIVACDPFNESAPCQLVFKADGKFMRLVFRPDEYMTELIKLRLKEANANIEEQTDTK